MVTKHALFLYSMSQILYTHEYNKRHRAETIELKTPAIAYISSDDVDDMENLLDNNGPLTDNEDENSGSGRAGEEAEVVRTPTSRTKSSELSREKVNEAADALLSMPTKEITEDADMEEEYNLPQCKLQ